MDIEVDGVPFVLRKAALVKNSGFPFSVFLIFHLTLGAVSLPAKAARLTSPQQNKKAGI